MARRKDKAPRPIPPESPAATPDATTRTPGLSSRQGRGRVLCVNGSERWSDAVRAAAESLGAGFHRASGIGEARHAVAAGQIDVALIDASNDTADCLQLVRDFTSASEGVCRFVVASAQENLECAVDAMRSGASDFLPLSASAEELALRMRAALEQARRMRDGQRRVERLQRICKRLNNARQEVSDQVDTLCNDLVSAYEDLAEQMNTATLATEFNALVRQELDVESLLRTTLEFMLTRTGPTNAAVFLPTGHHDYNLGAYVNYDIPRDTADVLLDHLADHVPQRFEELEAILHLEDDDAQAERMGEEASWLEDSTVVAFACRDDDECLAVVTLFRSRKTPFTPEILAQLEVMRDIFTEQLARVVRIHHRAIANPEWPGFDVEDDRGLAA